MLISNIYVRSKFINQNVPCNFNNDKIQLQIFLFTQSRKAGFALSIPKLK